MVLALGSYEVEVSAPGFQTRRVRVMHSGSDPHLVTLSPVPASPPAFFTLGSSSAELLKVHGMPDEQATTGSGSIVWTYGRSEVYLQWRSDQVEGWRSVDRGLKVRMLPGPNVTRKDYFTLGSHSDEVVRLHRTPSGISEGRPIESWEFAGGRVLISAASRRVVGWDNTGNRLKVRMTAGPRTTERKLLRKGSHRDDLVRLQGTPERIEPTADGQLWRYGSSSVFLSPKNRVRKWINSGSNLRVR